MVHSLRLKFPSPTCFARGNGFLECPQKKTSGAHAWKKLMGSGKTWSEKKYPLREGCREPAGSINSYSKIFVILHTCSWSHKQVGCCLSNCATCVLVFLGSVLGPPPNQIPESSRIASLYPIPSFSQARTSPLC